MPTKFWIIMGLMAILAIASIRLGWHFGVNHMVKKYTKELKQQAYEEFKKDYFDHFVELFEIKVESRAREIAGEIIEEMEEKENKDEGSGSN